MDTQKMFIAGDIGYNWGDYQKISLFYQDPKPLDVFIDSAGGSVSDANSFSALLRMRAAEGVEVRTVGLGRVASAAVGILLSGTRVEMDIMCNMLIHPITIDWFSGNADEMEQTAAAMRMMTNDLVNMYVRKIKKSGKATDKTQKQVEEMMTKQTWLSAQQALDLGLIDAIQTFETEVEEAENIIKTMPTQKLTQYQNFLNKLNTKPTIKNMAIDKEFSDKIDEIKAEQKGFFAQMTETIKNIFVKPTAPAAPEVVAPVVPATEVVTPVINNEAVTLKAQLEEQAQKMKELEQRNAELQTKAPVVQNSDVPEESNEPNNKAMQKLKGFQALVKTCPTLHNAIKTTYGK